MAEGRGRRMEPTLTVRVRTLIVAWVEAFAFFDVTEANNEQGPSAVG